MSFDLSEIFSELQHKIPHKVDGNHSIIFSSENLPQIIEPVTSRSLYIKKATHCYNDSYVVDSPWVFAEQEIYRQLGLLILAKIFHPFTDEIHVNLLHPLSEIKSLSIEFTERPLTELNGYRTLPSGFVYYPEIPARHPFLIRGGEVPVNELPSFGLTNAGFRGSPVEDYLNRDHIKIFGSDKGLVNLASLLLNIGGDENTQLEFQLEVESGFRGVGRSSTEIAFWLPGSDAWG